MPALDIADCCINETCPCSGRPVRPDSLREYGGRAVGFCNPGCRDRFETAVRRFEDQMGTLNEGNAPLGLRERAGSS